MIRVYLDGMVKVLKRFMMVMRVGLKASAVLG